MQASWDVIWAEAVAELCSSSLEYSTGLWDAELPPSPRDMDEMAPAVSEFKQQLVRLDPCTQLTGVATSLYQGPNLEISALFHLQQPPGY